MFDYDENDIKKSLNRIGLSKGDIIYCHSNIGLFGHIKNFISRDDVCSKFYNSIFNIIGDEGTLIVPTFTTHVPTSNIVFDKLTTPSNMGVFAEWIRMHPNSIRSYDPFYSFAAVGNDASYFFNNIPNNSFSKNSVFDRMLINDAKVLCFNHPGCTFLHYVERELRVPYRFDKSFICEQIIDGKKVKQNWKIWVRYLSDDKLIHSPKKFVEFVKDKSIAKFSEMGRGEILAIPTSMVFDSVKQGLQNDPWFLINADRNDSSVLIDKQYK